MDDNSKNTEEINESSSAADDGLTERQKADAEYQKNVGFRNPTEANTPSYYEGIVKENLAKENEDTDGGRKISANAIASLVIILVILVVYIIVGVTMGGFSSSKEEKTALEGDVELVGYFTGDSDYLADEDDLEAEIESFYQTTGVRVYIQDLTGGVALTSDELQEASDEFFEEFFTDEETASRYFLITLQADSDALCAFTVGEAAQEIIDEEALDIVYEDIEKYVNTDDMDDQYKLVYALTESATSIMYGDSHVATMIILLFIICYIIYMIWAKIRGKGKDDNNKDGNGRFGKNGKLGSINWKNL